MAFVVQFNLAMSQIMGWQCTGCSWTNFLRVTIGKKGAPMSASKVFLSSRNFRPSHRIESLPLYSRSRYDAVIELLALEGGTTRGGRLGGGNSPF